MRRLHPLLVLVLSACTRAPGVSSPTPVEAPRGEIGAAELRRDLFAFAADSMRGRETGTEDAARAAQFLTDRIQQLGLEPAGDSLYLQRIPLQRERFAATSRMVVEEGGRTVPLAIGRDLIPLVNLGPGVPPARRVADGPLVFAGYGTTLATPRRDDFAGLDLEDKVVVVVNGAPPGVDSATRANLESESTISERLARILPARPAAVIVLFTEGKRQFFDQLSSELSRTITRQGINDDVPDSERPLPMIMLGVVRAGSPLLPVRWPVDDRAQVLGGRRFAARVFQQRVPVSGFNVVGVVRGSDPVLSRTFVALGAHYDHLGIVTPVHGDSIANGADDDGSGTVALLAIARNLQSAAVKPRRSVLFVWHVGEEKGLLGSAWFVDHPTVPIDSIVAQLNADMIGRNARSELYLVGPRAAPNGQGKRLGAIVDSVNAREREPFVINRDYDSATHPEHVFERSDHYNYSRKGMPVAFFTTGWHSDYHRPSDEADKIDYDKLARVARLIRDVTVVLGNSSSRPGTVGR